MVTRHGEDRSLIPGDGRADSKWVYVRADICPHAGWLDFCMVSRHSDYIVTEMCSIDQYTAYRGNGGPKNVPNYCGNSSKNHYQKQNYINTSPVNCILSKVLCINTFWKGLNTDPDSNQRSIQIWKQLYITNQGPMWCCILLLTRKSTHRDFTLTNMTRNFAGIKLVFLHIAFLVVMV